MPPPSASSRFSLKVGSEPDPRFTLANERTFLAWIRTALALMAAGIAVEAFATDLLAPPLRTATAIALLVLAMLVSASACLRWFRVERALRLKQPLPLPLPIPLLACGLIAVALFLAVWLA